MSLIIDKRSRETHVSILGKTNFPIQGETGFARVPIQGTALTPREVNAPVASLHAFQLDGLRALTAPRTRKKGQSVS